ncbi:hypothetical protein BDN70DRAFT_875867 [Pholiota conissans]|uniref:Uncharacterized protein n=1 Tax=Pholiota conissans TaxID=109636 RepID=A0A9P5Z559_9AGAR|nr:hypothetical protein BDN70DRAFT_875867 [Pholiota conissans]
MAFSTGEIYATAFTTTVKESSFHYTLSIIQSEHSAKRIHAKEVFPGHFAFEVMEEVLQKDMTLCAALHIGNLGTHTLEEVIRICIDIPLTLPECDKEVDERFRCRVFLKQCIRALDEAGIIKCADADAVVNGELKTCAKENGPGILDGSGKFVVKKSNISS